MGIVDSVERVAAGIATGGLSEAAGYRGGNPFAPGNVLGNHSVTQDQVPLETPEQRLARQLLLQFGDTGHFGAYKAGGKTNAYNPSRLETSGLSVLGKLLASGLPNQYAMGDTALASLLNPDPNYISSQFDPFKAQVNRQIADAQTSLKRNAAFAGNLYSTSTIQGLGDIGARGNETLTSQLASLTDAALNRRAAAIPLAYQSGAAQEAMNQGRISAAETYGSLPRNLALAKRNEMLTPLQALQSIIGSNVNFGVPQVTVNQPNPMLDLLTAVITGGSKVLAAKGG